MRIVTDERWTGAYGIQRFSAEVLRRIPRELRVVGLRGGPVPSSALSPFWLAMQVGRLSANVFFSPGYMPPSWSQSRCIFTLHDLIHLGGITRASTMKRAFYQRVIRPATRSAFKILTVSEFSKREIVQWAGIDEHKVVVVGNGVSEAFSAEGDIADVGRPYVLYVGGNKPHKNLRRLIQAFASPVVPTELLLVLSGDPTPEVTAQINAAGLQTRVRHVGMLSETDLARYYRGASAVAMVSLYEGFGLPVVEAMACGTVVVASNTTSLPEIAGGAAITVNPLEPDDIAEGIRRAVEDQELRRELRLKGLARAAQFSWDRTARLAWDVVEAAALAG